LQGFGKKCFKEHYTIAKKYDMIAVKNKQGSDHTAQKALGAKGRLSGIFLAGGLTLLSILPIPLLRKFQPEKGEIQ